MPPPAAQAGSPGHQVKLPGPPPGASVAAAYGASTPRLVLIVCEPPTNTTRVMASSTKRCGGIRSVAGALPVAVTPPAPGIGPFGKPWASVRFPIDAWIGIPDMSLPYA